MGVDCGKLLVRMVHKTCEISTGFGAWAVLLTCPLGWRMPLQPAVLSSISRRRMRGEDIACVASPTYVDGLSTVVQHATS